ncbi:MAG: tRNA pseudouridine(55) synthase TruB [Polyangiaceae bacterium]|nr:tRNA pseudouridine(55) synthase TruB [Polyangiaceae bacterium]
MTSGVLLVDKPHGPTSHDVVAIVRRKLGTRRVGHAGTLDPAATGLLVVLVEEATKLAPYLSGEDKVYVATVALGRSTDTGDAAGKTVLEASLGEPLVTELERLANEGPGASALLVAAALDRERARTSQIPPAFSAIHVGGVRSHELARAGLAPELAPRDVSVRALTLESADPAAATLIVQLEVSKGYYVRSFARDLGDALGVPAHLSALRRTRSGAFSIDEARALDAVSADALKPLEDAAKCALSTVVVDPNGERLLRTGRPIEAATIATGPVAVLSEGGALVAIAEPRDGKLTVLRGFSP